MSYLKDIVFVLVSKNILFLTSSYLLDCVDGSGRLAADVLHISRYEVAHPVQSCVLGVREIFAYCHQKAALQHFLLPQVYPWMFFST